jgi:hypothetical protein
MLLKIVLKYRKSCDYFERRIIFVFYNLTIRM